MKFLRFARVAAIAALTAVSSAWMPPRTVTLSVSGMTCATCPITVKKALTKVPGVTRVEVRYEAREVVVTFDDSKTTTAALVKATTDAGYPSTLKNSAIEARAPR
jgi:mercuric ion binding protein